MFCLQFITNVPKNSSKYFNLKAELKNPEPVINNYVF